MSGKRVSFLAIAIQEVENGYVVWETGEIGMHGRPDARMAGTKVT